MQSFLIPSDETPEQAAARKKRAVAAALMSPQEMPQSVGEGIAAMGDAFASRMQKQNAAFPAAPGGAKPSFITAMKNMFGSGRNGGLR